jgi:hypothetical protein
MTNQLKKHDEEIEKKKFLMTKPPTRKKIRKKEEFIFDLHFIQGLRRRK